MINNFIITELNKLYEKFPSLKIRYEYQDNYLHLIEIKPFKIYKSDVNFIISEMDIEKRFEQLNDKDEILFISNNSLNKIEEPIFTIGYK